MSRLEPVGVLIFIHEDELEPALVMVAHVLVIAQQFEHNASKSSKSIALVAVARGVALLEVHDLGRELGEIVVLLLQNFRHRLVRVDGQ